MAKQLQSGNSNFLPLLKLFLSNLIPPLLSILLVIYGIPIRQHSWYHPDSSPSLSSFLSMILAATSGLSVGSSIRKIGRWSFLGPTSLVTPSQNAILIPFGSVGGAKFRKVVPFREEVPFSESQEMCHQLLQPLNDVYH